jgi:hypothetical protein
MSMTSGAELPLPLIPHSKSFSARILGILVAPKSTFRAIAKVPDWLGVLLLTFVVTASVWAVVFQTPVGRFALLDRWESTAIAFGQTIDDGRYAALEASSERGAIYAVAGAFAAGPLLATVLSGLLVLALRPSSRGVGRVTYSQVLAVVAYAGIILALREVVAAPITYVRGAIGSPLTLRLMLSGLDDASPFARFASGIDLFVLWWIAVLAVGLSVLYRRPARGLALRLLSVYVAMVAILVTTMAVIGGTP